jgi:hypothetical protein
MHRRRLRGADGIPTNHRDEELMRTSLHVTQRATATVRRLGEVLPTAWVTVSDDAESWELSGSFLDLFLFAERLAAALLDEMPEHTRQHLADLLADEAAA